MTEQALSIRIDAAIAERAMLTHPFYQAWEEGVLTREQLRTYAKQYFHHVEAFPLENDVFDRLLAILARAFQPIAHFHPAHFAFRIADHQQHGEFLRHPVTGVALVFDAEDFRAVALPLLEVGIA